MNKMKDNKTATSAAIILLLTGHTTAWACSVCNSNLSYNSFRFAPLWLGLLIIWVQLIWSVNRSFRKRDPSSITGRTNLRKSVMFLGALLFLYLIGAHLIAMLLFPIYLIVVIYRSGKLKDPATLDYHKRIKSLAQLFLALLLVTIPLGYLLPPVISEPETRVKANLVQNRISYKVGIKTDSVVDSAQADSDPFAYRIVKVPALDLAVQNFWNYYRALPDDESKISFVQNHDRKIAWSRGPDGKFDLDIKTATAMLSDETTAGIPAHYMYDATNGSGTPGDIIARAGSDFRAF